MGMVNQFSRAMDFLREAFPTFTPKRVDPGFSVLPSRAGLVFGALRRLRKILESLSPSRERVMAVRGSLFAAKRLSPERQLSSCGKRGVSHA